MMFVLCLKNETFPTPKNYTNKRAFTIFNFASNVSKGHFSQSQAIVSNLNTLS